MYSHKKTGRKFVYISLAFVLIIFGIVLMSLNLGDQQPDLWEVLIKISPVILIFAGVMGLSSKKNAGLYTFLITFGLALILSNFGRISWSSWEVLFTFGPVLILAVGIDLIFDQKNNWQLLIAGLLVISIMGIIALVFDSGIVSNPLDTVRVKQSSEGATSSSISLSPSVSTLKIKSQGSSELVVEGMVKHWEGETIHSTYEIQNDIGSFNLASSGMLFLYEPGVKNRAEWDLGLSSRMPISLIIDHKIGEQQLDLSSLAIMDFKSNLKYGKFYLLVPSNQSFTGEIKLAFGDIVIDVPEGASVRISGRPVIGSLRYPSSFTQHNDYVESPGFSTSESPVILKIDHLIGQVVIHQK